MQNSEEYEKLINNLSENNFNLLVKEYIKEYYETNELHISNGPYDGGMDLVFFKKEREQKRNIQITVQKTRIEEKLFEDVQKSMDNVDSYNYLSKLDFYISSSISQNKKQKYVRRAEIDFGIDLKIIDAKKLAGNMDEFPSIRETLKKIYQFNEKESIFSVTKQNKVLFNVLSTGEDSAKIKRHLIHTYILTSLFEKPNLSLDDLHKEIMRSVTVELDKESLFQEVNYLKSKKSIEGKENFSLSEDYQEKLNELLELNNIQEKDLTIKIDEVLNKKELDVDPKMISRKLIDMYVEHFQFEIEEFESSEDSFANSTKRIFNEIVSLLHKSGIENKLDSENLAKDILNVTSTNDFLTKLGASSMYLKLYNSEQLEDFINNTRRRVCLDTQILLRLLCVLHKPITSDHSLKAVYNFHKIAANTELQLDIFTSDDYVEEVAAHIQKGLKIYNYIKLPIFDKVGKTRNVFYNFYRELLSMEETPSSNFRDFIENELLGIKVPDEFDLNFVNVTSRRLIRLFENLDYEVISPQFYENYEEIKKKFEIDLSFKHQIRSGKAIKHDVRTALYMSDEQNHFDFEESIFLEPYIITWDFQFYHLRNIIRDNYKQYKPWFVYTPHNFIEKIQLGSFKIKPESINETILSILESDYNSSSNNRTFIDVISTIFNKENVGELKLAQKFANIEEGYIEEQEDKENFKFISSEESPLTTVLSMLISHYNDPETKYSMAEFTELCENDSKADILIKIITESIEKIKDRTLEKEKLFEQVNELLENAA
ncbi:hypothetical protein MG296_14390 [Flavobacteriaceae bacterium TK19130]|nr:hypothetical protein [Thermobacterium salinum]